MHVHSYCLPSARASLAPSILALFPVSVSTIPQLEPTWSKERRWARCDHRDLKLFVGPTSPRLLAVDRAACKLAFPVGRPHFNH